MGYAPEALEAFEDFARDSTRGRVEYGAALFTCIFFVAFIVGQIGHPGKVQAELAARWLPIQILGSALCWAMVRYTQIGAKHPLACACLAFSVVSFAGGTLLGSLGNLDGPFFYNVYVLPPLTVVLPCALGPRIGMTLAILLPFLLAYFLPHPEYLDHPYIHIPAMYLASFTLVSVLLSHWVYGLTRDRFLFSRTIERQKLQLAKFNAELAEEVIVKTNTVHKLAGQLETVRIDERADLARALHDDLGQLIVGARMELNNLARSFNEDEQSAEELRFLNDIIETLANSSKRLVSGLRNHTTAPVDMQTTIAQLVQPIQERSQLQLKTNVAVGDEISTATREAIYRTVQEALTNVLKHANAEQTEVAVFEEEDEVVVRVRDDGAGFDVDHDPSGWGLIGMRERATALGGAFSVSSDDAGTEIEVRLPAERSA